MGHVAFSTPDTAQPLTQGWNILDISPSCIPKSSKQYTFLAVCRSAFIPSLGSRYLSNMLTMVRSLVIFCNLIALSHAYTTFQTNCTAPSTSVNFVSSNETRGTIDILWSCLFTIIACTWTVQHLNVPEQREDRDKGWLGDVKWALKRTFRSAKWMLATAVAPEILIMKSLGDLFAINIELERLSQLATEDEVPWSRAHSLFANMGGFVIRGNVPERLGQMEEVMADPASSTQAGPLEAISNDLNPDVILQPGSDSTQLPSKEMGSADVDIQLTTPSSEYSNPYHLLASDLVALKEAGFLARLPYITKAELNDKNKSDSLVRFVAVVQILWIIIQIIVRGARHLAVSQLEIAVVASAICAVVIYGLNWEKPKGVQTPYTVLQYRGRIPQAVLETVGKGRSTESLQGSVLLTLFENIRYLSTWGRQHQHLLPGSPIPDHFTPDRSRSFTQIDLVQMAGLILGGTIFGAIHVAAWDFVFPTLVEMKLWGAASIVCTTVPLFIVSTMIVIHLTIEIVETKHLIRIVYGLLLGLLFTVLWVLYFAARLFLLVEIFRSLCFLPPSAYITTWATNVPYVA